MLPVSASISPFFRLEAIKHKAHITKRIQPVRWHLNANLVLSSLFFFIEILLVVGLFQWRYRKKSLRDRIFLECRLNFFEITADFANSLHNCCRRVILIGKIVNKEIGFGIQYQENLINTIVHTISIITNRTNSILTTGLVTPRPPRLRKLRKIQWS